MPQNGRCRDRFPRDGCSGGRGQSKCQDHPGDQQRRAKLSFPSFWIFTALFPGPLGLWWDAAKQEATLKANAARVRADLVSSQLAEHKLHVAESYISKAGHRETTDQIMGAISSVKSAVEGTNQRIDRLFDERHGR